MSFSYRRMYAELSQGELQDLLDVGLTGAPKFVQEQHPKQSYVAQPETLGQNFRNLSAKAEVIRG